MSTVFTSDEQNRRAFKRDLSDQVEQALTPPTPESDPEPVVVEIIEKYANAPFTVSRTDSRLFRPLEAIDPSPDAAEESPSFVLDSDAPKRNAFKETLVNKVAASLTPPIEPHPEPIQILDSYSPWRIVEPMETIDPGLKEEKPFILDRDVPKRAAFKDSLLGQVAETLAPVPVEPEQPPIEIIEQYARGTQRPCDPIEAIDPGFENNRSIVVPDGVLHSDIPQRNAFRQSLLSKVDDATVPRAPAPEEAAPVEIIEKYAHGVQRSFVQRSFESIEPGFEQTRKVVVPDGLLDSDVPRRDAFKESLLDKVDQILTPPPPAREDEPVPVEILEKYAHGSGHPLDPDELAPEFKKTVPFILDSDVPKREATREALLLKASTVAPPPAVPVEEAPVEILDYSQRTLTPLGFEFPEVGQPRTTVADNALPLQKADPTVPVNSALGPVLRLPANYRELEPQALYGVLIRTPNLKHSSDTANLVLDILAGRTTRTAEFMVVEDPLPEPVAVVATLEAPKPADIPEQFRINESEKRAAVEAQLAKKSHALPPKPPERAPDPVLPLHFDKPADWKHLPPTVLRAELLATGATPEQAAVIMSRWLETEPVSVAHEAPVPVEVAVELPRGFGSLRVADKYAYLTTHALLSPEDANDAVAAFDSAPQYGTKTFTFTFADIIDPDKRHERRELLSEKAAASHTPPGVEDPEDKVFLLPTNYTDLSEVELHYLMAHTDELGYSHETVYESLDILFGRVAQPPHISFQTITLDNPVVIGRREEPISTVKVETSHQPKARAVSEG